MIEIQYELSMKEGFKKEETCIDQILPVFGEDLIIDRQVDYHLK